MPGKATYSARVLVLRKRKLGESDLILSLLAGDGSLIEAVAKGARKPANTFATRLELFCESEVLLARGRNLDIASEVRLMDPHDALRSDIAKTYAAAPILDCLVATTFPNLPVEHLYDMATSALRHIDAVPEMTTARACTAAFMVKLFALMGTRPQTAACLSCGNPLPAEACQVSFSYTDGGYVCDNCSTGIDRVRMDATTLQWANAFLGSTFDEVAAMDTSPEATYAVLHFCNQWLRETQSINSKALNQLLTFSLL